MPIENIIELLGFALFLFGLTVWINRDAAIENDDPEVALGTIRFHCLTKKEGSSVFGEDGGKWVIQIREPHIWSCGDQVGKYIAWMDIDEKFFRYGKTYASLEEAQEAYRERINYRQPEDVYAK